MGIEEQIVDWASSRPGWQRAVLRRLAAGDSFGPDDYALIADRLTAGSLSTADEFGIEDMPAASPSREAVQLNAIRDLVDVNALVQQQALNFAADGLTVVYGDNGSGKSGYARLIKKVVRARHVENVLTDIFNDAGQAKPAATLEFEIANKSFEIDWPESSVPELSQIGFYDHACGEAYVSADLEIGYRPSALFVMDGLIKTCDEVRAVLDGRLATFQPSAAMPILAPGTAAAAYVSSLSAGSDQAELESLCKLSPHVDSEIKELTDKEARLRVTDPASEKRRLMTSAKRLDSLAVHLSKCSLLLDDAAELALRKLGTRLAEARSAATIASKRSFDREPLPSVGSQGWKTLWEAARAFAAESVPDSEFPVADGDARCVLCHQQLQPEAVDRLRRFEGFVQDHTQRVHDEALRGWNGANKKLAEFVVQSPEVLGALEELRETHAAFATAYESFLTDCELRRTGLLEGFQEEGLGEIAQRYPLAALDSPSQLATGLRSEANAINPTDSAAKLQKVNRCRLELEARKSLAEHRCTVLDEITRLERLRQLNLAKEQTATAAISRKSAELARAHVTTVIRDRFTRETHELHLERVTLQDVGGKKGTLRHQPAFVGAAQDARLVHVLSEGEQTVLGLAGFFTEAHLDESKSAIVLDDPVNSLDHVRRGRVAERLAEFAKERQVIVFTHDVVFVGNLAKAAVAARVGFVERSVERLGSGKPGACCDEHPWKAKNANQRLHTLGEDLDKLRKRRHELGQQAYEKETAQWAGCLSETWERLISVEVVGQVFDLGTQEVRPRKFRILSKITENDDSQLQASYWCCSQWARRHDKSLATNYVAPTLDEMKKELELVKSWYERVRKYKK